jgi:4-diphosphocytidyl-2-C-methyl-D-erythritol kinase
MINNSSLLTPYSSLSLKAPAKINWFLRVLRKRDDGYHDIESLMQCVRLYDLLDFHHADKIKITSDLDIPLEDNLVYKAVSLIQKHTSCRKGVKITLKKNIPVSAGLGGGSSDAAYTLLGLNTFWRLGLGKKELSSIGLEIGSDVPFFMNGPSAFVEGRGEKITPLHIHSSVVFLLVKPPVSVYTRWAYESFDKLRIGELTKRAVDIKLFCQTLNNKDFTSLNNMLTNDLEWVVIKKYPVVNEIKERLLEKGAILSAMSGSGPTVFGVFNSVETAKSASKVFIDCWTAVVQTMI